VVSGTLWGGTPRQILDLARAGRLHLCTSTALLLELAEVLGRSKFADRVSQYGDVQFLLDGYAALVEVIEPGHTSPVISADPDDDHVLACALAASADYIVSGDRHLLDLGTCAGISILNAADFLTAYTKSLSP
jgi:putative PIN family toxin of toxin-antitoxin system